MAHASLTRRVRFSARHRFWNPGWSEARNNEVFGASASAEYHAHDYICDVTVRGKLDDLTGMVVDLAELDRILTREVRDRFDHKSINDDVTEFGGAGLVASGENLAKFVFERVDAALTRGAKVTEVTVAEDDTLRSTYRGD